jgi:hypothetical protein
MSPLHTFEHATLQLQKTSNCEDAVWDYQQLRFGVCQLLVVSGNADFQHVDGVRWVAGKVT